MHEKLIEEKKHRSRWRFYLLMTDESKSVVSSSSTQTRERERDGSFFYFVIGFQSTSLSSNSLVPVAFF
jgi:hypothetical protein